MRRSAGGSAATFGRYLLFQIPGMVVAGLLLTCLVHWEQLSRTLGAALFAIWVAGEIALFPVLRIAYEPGDDQGGAAGLVGARGIARDALASEGWVQIGAERWRAVLADGAAAVAAGATVRVLEVRSLTLVVEPAAEGDARPGGADERPPERGGIGS